MTDVIIFPDTAALVLSALGDAMSVDTYGTPPTDRDGSETFLVCRRVGGPSRDVVVDDASVALEAWAPTPAAAHDLLQEARGVLHSLAHTVVDGVPIYRVQEFAGPAFLPDPESSHPRYTLTASVSVRGAVTGS
jgi:hypothetical protein